MANWKDSGLEGGNTKFQLGFSNNSKGNTE